MKSRGEGKKKNETGILSSPVCVRSGEKGDLKAIFNVSLQQQRKKKKVGGRREVTRLAIPPSALRVRFVLRIREESVSFAMMSLPRSSFSLQTRLYTGIWQKKEGRERGGRIRKLHYLNHPPILFRWKDTIASSKIREEGRDGDVFYGNCYPHFSLFRARKMFHFSYSSKRKLLSS